VARCSIDTLPLPRHPQHHELVTRGAELIAEQTKTVTRRGADYLLDGII